MPLAVLIIAGEGEVDAGGTPAAMLPFAGQTLLEYQVRLARACGGGHIVVLVEQLPAAMIALIDRLHADGIDIDVAREPHDAADRIHPEEQVLLFSPGFVGSRQIVEGLIGRAKPSLVTLPDAPAHAGFERIDATDRWSGLALLTGQSVRETAAMLGDWSISSTLMRSALQSGASRWRLETPEGLAIISDAAQAEAMSATLMQTVNAADQSPFAELITQPLAKLIAPHLLKWGMPLKLLAVTPLILLGSAVLLGVFGWFATGFAFLTGAALAEGVATILVQLSVRDENSLSFYKRAKPLVFYILLLLLGWVVSSASEDWSALVLAVWGSSIIILQPQKAERMPKWGATTESGSLIMLLALVFSAPAAGLLLIVGHGIAGQITDRFFRS